MGSASGSDSQTLSHGGGVQACDLGGKGEASATAEGMGPGLEEGWRAKGVVRERQGKHRCFYFPSCPVSCSPEPSEVLRSHPLQLLFGSPHPHSVSEFHPSPLPVEVPLPPPTLLGSPLPRPPASQSPPAALRFPLSSDAPHPALREVAGQRFPSSVLRFHRPQLTPRRARFGDVCVESGTQGCLSLAPFL